MTSSGSPQPTPGGRASQPQAPSGLGHPGGVGPEVAAWLKTLTDEQRTAIVDLFAGPGGWDVALRRLGLDPVGVEWDAAACETRRAAGLRTTEADVAELDPTEFVRSLGVVGALFLFIASPPCQTFSSAGGGAGREIIAELQAIARQMLGKPSKEADEALAMLNEADPRSLLVLEPARWIADLRPRNIALEQVPAVLPIWESMKEPLKALGYSVWTGILSAEQFGVPQTRKRAFLIASLDREVAPPEPTHKRYVAPKKVAADVGSLFGEDDMPERGRITHDADRGPLGSEHQRLEWVSMAEALGWDEGPSPRPAPTVTGGGGETGGVETFASKGAREAARAAVAASGAAEGSTGWMVLPTFGKPGDRSSTVDTKIGHWPVSPPTALDRRQTGGDGTPVPLVTVDRPAPTMTASGLASGRDVWVTERPATTVACDPRISPPGHHADGGPDGPRQMEGAIRVTQAQAAVLQSFPSDHPWQGTRSKQFEQIGNAVPPLLAEAVARATFGLPSRSFAPVLAELPATTSHAPRRAAA